MTPIMRFNHLEKCWVEIKMCPDRTEGHLLVCAAKFKQGVDSLESLATGTRMLTAEREMSLSLSCAYKTPESRLTTHTHRITFMD